MNKIIIKEKTLNLNDKVYYKGGEMRFTGIPKQGKNNPPQRIICSWYNKDLNKMEEGIFDLSELTIDP